ncbi:MAG: LysR family transcriptional regulator [Exiguobacterium indicum]
MQVSEMEMLITLSEELNMRRAAERLFVSQPALSQRLVAIERRWGTKLFIRSSRGLSITPQGEKVIGLAKEMNRKELELKSELTAEEGAVYGTLRIAVSSIMGQYWLPRVLKRFVERYPHVRVQLVTGWSSEMMRHMLEEHFHIGIIRGNPDWKGVKERLFSDPLYLVDSELTSIEQLRVTDRPFIQFKSDSTYYQEILEWWQDRFASPPSRTLVVDQIETCKQMALHGIGFAILPESTIQQSNEVMQLPLKTSSGKILKRDTWILSTESMLELKQVQAFWDIVKEEGGSQSDGIRH